MQVFFFFNNWSWIITEIKGIRKKKIKKSYNVDYKIVSLRYGCQMKIIKTAISFSYSQLSLKILLTIIYELIIFYWFFDTLKISLRY